MSRVLVVLSMTLLMAAMLGTARPADAQEAQPVRIVLQDGSRLVGTILEETDDAIRFRTASGVAMTIPREQVVGTEVLKGRIVGKRYLRSDPNRIRLFFAPTARSLKGGQGFFSLYELFFPSFTVGLVDVATVSGGISLVPGAGEQLVYGSTKLTLVERPGMALAAGAFAATFTEGGSTGGLLYGLGTFGREELALTVGAMFAFGGGEFEETPILLVGGEVQLSNHVKLISENYVIPTLESLLLTSAGVRFFGERIAADFGLFTVPEVEGFPFLPWVGFAYNFGR